MLGALSRVFLTTATERPRCNTNSIMFWSSVSTLAAVISFASAFKFDGPAPTPLGELLGYDEHGWTPKPTGQPSLPELFRRQANPELCGYALGDADYPVSCRAGRTCVYDSSLSWFGCCTGTRRADCPIATTCVENTRISSCLSNSACRSDVYLTACTARADPYCLLMFRVISRTTYNHLECTDEPGITIQIAGLTATGSVRPSITATRSTRQFSDDDESSTGRGFVLSTRPTVDTETSTPLPSSSSTSALTTSRTTGTGTGTAGNFNANTASTTTTTGGAAIRTAEAVFGIGGGVVGLLAILL